TPGGSQGAGRSVPERERTIDRQVGGQRGVAEEQAQGLALEWCEPLTGRLAARTDRQRREGQRLQEDLLFDIDEAREPLQVEAAFDRVAHPLQEGERPTSELPLPGDAVEVHLGRSALH